MGTGRVYTYDPLKDDVQADGGHKRADPRLVALRLLAQTLGGDVLVVEDDRFRDVAVSETGKHAQTS